IKRAGRQYLADLSGHRNQGCAVADCLVAEQCGRVQRPGLNARDDAGVVDAAVESPLEEHVGILLGAPTIRIRRIVEGCALAADARGASTTGHGGLAEVERERPRLWHHQVASVRDAT